ncbi:type I restriction-modification system, M subunit [Pseudomonas aeruginosa PA38182]|nr:type I restriction-modification system, M subunit [Pseudomonas aeruginosa PA38182]
MEERDYYKAENVFWVPEAARWEGLRAAKQADIGKRIDEALAAIEAENPSLKNILNSLFQRQQVAAGGQGAAGRPALNQLALGGGGALGGSVAPGGFLLHGEQHQQQGGEEGHRVDGPELVFQWNVADPGAHRGISSYRQANGKAPLS